MGHTASFFAQNILKPAPSLSRFPPGKRRRRFVWDGARIRAVDTAAAAAGEETASGALGSRLRNARRSAWAAFFPDPADVTPDYWAYARWRAGHRLCSSMLTNFATQSLLVAVGVGARRSLPAAAAANWLLKDGLGRLGRLGVATRFGQSFDSDLKRFRFASSLLFAASIALEFATPAFPQHFLALAAAANVGKSVGLTTYISTQPSFGKSFARRENLADITAKAQAQQMVVDTFGLAACVAIMRGGAQRVAAKTAAAGVVAAATGAAAAAVPATAALPWLFLPMLAVGDLTSIYHELKAVHLRTLNRERAELATAGWLGSGRAAVPSAEDVARAEPLVAPLAVGGGRLPLRLTTVEDAVGLTPDALDAALARHARDRFLIVRTPPPGSATLLPHALAIGLERAGLVPGAASGGLAAIMRTDAIPDDVLAAVLVAAHARREAEATDGGGGGSVQPPAPPGGPDPVLEAATRAARKDVPKLLKALKKQGWQAAPFLLSPRERGGYVVLG
jgi:hypothetical protein